MKSLKIKTVTLKKIALAMMIAAGSMNSAYAVITGTTGTIRDETPILKANGGCAHSLDFVASDAASLKTSDSITYKYTDTDGDKDGGAPHLTCESEVK